MASQIDPTKPADGVPAVKADLRASLAAAKGEIEALQSGKAAATHTHLIADVTDAGALASRNTVAGGDIDAAAVTSAKIADGAVTEIKIGAAAVATAKLADAAVTPAKLDRAYSETGHGHALATAGAAGFLSAADKSKLDGIEAGAQVNRALASQTEAQAGSNNTTVMTPLRTAQAVAGGSALVSTAAGNTLSANLKAWRGSQSAYDALGTYDDDTLYIIV